MVLTKRASVWRKWVVGLLLLALLGAVAAWLARKPIAKALALRWCVGGQLVCEFEIDRLDLARVEISNLRVAGPSAANLLAARSIAVKLDWQGIFKPVATSIRLDQPVISAAYDGRNITLGGLEKRLPGGDGNAAMPALDIRDGRLILATPAGDITGSFDADGTWPARASARFVLAPAELRAGTNRLSLDEGALNLTAKAGKLDGTLKLNLARLDFDNMQASGVSITARIEDTQKPQLDWQASLETFSQKDSLSLSLSRASASGRITLSQMLQATDTDILALLETLTLSGQVGQAAWQDYRGEAMNFDLSATRSTNARLELGLETEISNTLGPSFSGEKITLSFAGSAQNRLATLSGTGNLVLSDMAMRPERRAALLSALSARLPFEAYANDLTGALDKGLARFTLGGQYRLDLNTLQDWQLTLPQTIAVQSDSGLSAVLVPGQGQSAAVIEPGAATITGVLTIKGGGLPQIDTDIHNLYASGANISLKTGGLTLQPWRAGGTVISADLNQFGLESTASSLHLNALGELGLSGTLLGISLEQTRLFGGIDAARGAEGWRVQTANQDCLGLNLGRARTSNNLVLQPTALSICPQGGRLVHQENGSATGQLELGDIQLPFTGRGISGNAALGKTAIDWSTSKTLVLRISAEQLELPMLIAGRSLNLNTPAPYVEIDLGAHTHITARLDQLSLSGDLIPANVTIGQARFNGQLEPGAFNAAARATEVRISDINADPVYRPLRAEFDLLFEGSRLSMFGPVNLVGSDTAIADVQLNLDLLQLNGTGRVKTRQLDFTPQGLQPKDLSDLFRGFLSNGRGTITGLADFTIRSGILAGTGEINAVNFGFDTFRTGAIDGINGRISFSDILTLTTPPGQRVTIARLNPGIPLEDGEIEFQILGGKQANIERASWPFAGGTLDIDPTRWSIAGTSDILKVNARAIKLAQLINILSLPDVKAEGTISGTFPIELRGGNAFIRDARLAADNNGGKLSYTGDAARQAGSADERVQAAFTALRDFRFTVLEIGVDGNLVDDIIVSARLLGSNPDVYGGAEFDFNISVDSKLAQLIQSGRRAASTSWITDAIVNDPPAEPREPFN